MKVTLLTTPVPFSTLNPNTVALDGAVRGTHLDLPNNRWSFDHHAENQPSISTRSAALQTLLALRAGLDVSNIDEVLVSSIDADSVVATSLILNPSYAFDTRVVSLIVSNLDTVDSLGPAGALSAINRAAFFKLKAGFKEELTTELLIAKVELFEDMVENDTLFEVSGGPRKSPATLVSFSPTGDVVGTEEGEFSMADLYASATVGLLYSPEKVTVGAKSSFVTAKNFLVDGLFARFNEAEKAAGAELSEDGEIKNGWGGKDLVGGSPFKGKTLLSLEEVVAIFSDFLKS